MAFLRTVARKHAPQIAGQLYFRTKKLYDRNLTK